MVSRYSWAILLLITVLMIIPGCSGQSGSAQKPSQKENQQAELPPEFEKIVSDTEQIILLADQKWKMRQATALKKSTQLHPQGNMQDQGEEAGGQQKHSEQPGQTGKQSSESGQGQNENSGNQQGQSEQQNKQQGQTGGMASTWEQEIKSLMSIHENWTSLQAKAMQAGMNNTTKMAFDEDLDRLTAAVNEENDVESLMAAIDLYGQFTDIARLFKEELPPIFYDTKQQVMMVTALGQQEDWEAAQSQSISMLEDWDDLKNQSRQAEKTVVSCTEISIQDLARAVDNQSRELVIIKGEIAVKEIMKLKKELSKQKMTSPQ